MVKFCLKNRYGNSYAIYECMCSDCNWMGELKDLASDNWDHFRYCPKCGEDDIEVFDDPVYCSYVTLPTEWDIGEGVNNGA